MADSNYIMFLTKDP